jgi:DNA modification methylase
VSVKILKGDCRDVLRSLDADSVQTCVTSPPYWGLRDYGIPPSVWGGDPNCEHRWGAEIAVNATNHTTKARWNHTRNGRDELQPIKKRVSWLRTEVKQGQFCQHCGAWAGAFGLEPTYQAYVDHAVEVFQEVRRVLRPDGTLWLNLGDSYCSGNRATWRSGASENKGQDVLNDMPRPAQPADLKPKDLIGIPWRVAFALQADGWWLRQDIIWSKPNPMPESVEDRCTKAHEYLFLMTKSDRYHYNAEAIKEASLTEDPRRAGNKSHKYVTAYNGGSEEHRTKAGLMAVADVPWLLRNRRSVWSIATAPYPDAHFATFPPDLVTPCVLAGCPEGGTVLDPFGGAGTTGLVADRLKRNAILIELNPEYAGMAKRRIEGDAGLFAEVNSQSGKTGSV